jgi:hypothetical protein
MDTALTLFDPEPYRAETVAGEAVSAGRRLTARQLATLGRGFHPIAKGLRLHADAAPAGDRRAPGLRCGTCRFRVLQNRGNRSYPKCQWPDETTYRFADMPRVTCGAATDCRAWYPACVDYQPVEVAQ